MLEPMQDISASEQVFQRSERPVHKRAVDWHDDGMPGNSAEELATPEYASHVGHQGLQVSKVVRAAPTLGQGQPSH
jgi:hypothetical protein